MNSNVVLSSGSAMVVVHTTVSTEPYNKLLYVLKGDKSMERKEHLQWCKDRALEYVEVGDVKNAWASMASDLQKHDETKEHPAINLGMMMMIGGQLSTPREMRDFIEGFN